MYQQGYTISIDDDEKIIKFAGKSEKRICQHKHIQISSEENEVLCTDCNVRLNPILWIEKHLKQLNAVTERNNRILSEYREISKKLEKKGNFLCKHCHEMNTIDFRKLPSNAAIQRGISVVEQDHPGMKVEIK